MGHDQKLNAGSVKPSVRRVKRQRGSQMVESMLMILPFLALAFLVIDSAWGLFIRATLQYAVHEGVRYAVTGQTQAGSCQIASIQAVVATQSLGFATSANTTVSYLDPSSLTSLPNGAGVDVGGNLVQVQATYEFTPLTPLFRSALPITFNVISADILEGSPGGTPPCVTGPGA